MANSSFWYLELSQFLLCFSGDQRCKEHPEKSSHSGGCSHEHHLPANWSGASSPRVATPRQPDSRPHSMPPLVLYLIQFLRGKPSLSLLSKELQSSTECFSSRRKGQTHTLHACLSTLTSCMSRLRNINEQPCFFQLVCYVHYSRKNN